MARASQKGMICEGWQGKSVDRCTEESVLLRTGGPVCVSFALGGLQKVIKPGCSKGSHPRTEKSS